MKDIDKILRAGVLESQIKKLSRLLDKKNQERFKLQAECKHEVVITSGRYYQRCLFCRKLGNHHTSFWESEFIETNNHVLNYWDPEVRFEIIRRLFVKAAMEHPELSNVELKKIVKNQYDNITPEVEEIACSVIDKH